jgi:SAM-dependent methyltransferase
MKRRVTEASERGSRGARFLLDMAGYGGHWARRAMNDDIDAHLRPLATHELDVAEISGRRFADRRWRSYRALEFPEFDVCADGALHERSFDLIFCEQVLEHLWRPADALENLATMLRPGGRLVVSTPFMVKIHRCPDDFWRFSPDCLRRMLEEVPLEVERLESWGNRRCVSADLPDGRWTTYRPFRTLRNEPDVPVVVWAYARKAP